MTDGEFICAFNFLASHRGPVFRIILREFSSVKKNINGKFVSILCTMEDKNPWDNYKNLPSSSNILSMQMWHNIHFCNSSDASNSPRLHPRNNAGINKLFLGQGKVYRVHKIQLCLGSRWEGRQFKAYRVKCPKTFDLHCSYRN